jgi:hypothetical protein
MSIAQLGRGRSRRAAGIIGVGLMGASLSWLPGCNIVGPLFVLVHGPEKIPPDYTLDKNRPTVVFIDDPANRVPRRQLKTLMGETVDKVLLDRELIKSDKKVNNLISSSSVLLVSSKDKSDTPMSIVNIGKAVGAEVVVWIMVDQFTLSPDGQSNNPTVSFRMKIVDTVAEKRIWPEAEPSGKPYSFALPAASALPPRTSAERSKAEMALAEYAGLGISELFYEVERPTAVRAGK